MKKLMLSVAVFMFAVVSSGSVFAQDPVKKEKPATEQTEEKKESAEAKEETKKETPAAEEKAEKPATEKTEANASAQSAE